MKIILSKILIFLLNLASKTWKFNVKGNLYTNPSIIIFWHSYLLSGWKYLSKKGKYFAVVSPSRDGQYLVDLLTKWDLSFVRGSSDKNSKELLHQIVELAKLNKVSITPDGPRGPKFKLKPGAVVAASRSNVPLQFLQIKNLKKKIFHKSWDKFELPLPFSTIEIKISEPIIIPSEPTREEVDAIIQTIEFRMNNV